MYFNKKADREQIEEDAEGTGDAVVALPCRTGRVRDGNLADGGSVPAGQSRDETMHLAVEGDILDDLAAVGLEGCAEVVDVDTGEGGHELVCGAGGDAAHEEVVAALVSPATNDIVALFQFGEEARNFVGIVLQIAVHGEDVSLPARGQTRQRERRSDRSCGEA